MFGSALLKCSELQRPFWLTVALSIMLLASVSTTIAQAAHPSRLAHALKRDLGALRAQLELIDPWAPDAERPTVASNTDVGDGSPSFQRRSMAAIVGAANRRLARLLEGHREEAGDARGRTAAEALRLAMQDLQHQIDRLTRVADPTEAAAVRERIGTLLDRSERELGVLLEGLPKAPALPAVVARDTTADERAP